MSLTSEKIWSWLASICVILMLVLFSYTIYCVVDNMRLRNSQKGIVQSIQVDIKIDDNREMATKCGAATLFFGLLSGFFHYKMKSKKKEGAGIKVELERDSQVAVANVAVEQSPEAETVKDQRSEGLKELENASVETNDIGRPKEEAAETFEERTKASKSDDNVPKESRDQDQDQRPRSKQSRCVYEVYGVLGHQKISG